MVPLIAVHLFVFYFGIMADVTPPVGLATFAGAAIAKENPIDVGLQGSVYAFRTVVLPFIWIFNPALLLIDVHGWTEALLVGVTATIASLVFAAATMAWFRIKCRWWEVLLLLVATFFLFRPDWFADQMAPEYTDAPASKFYEVAASLGPGDRLVFLIRGQSLEGDETKKTVALRLGPKEEHRQRGGRRAQAARRTRASPCPGMGEMLQVSTVRFGSTAAKARIEQGFEIVGVKVPTDRINAHWFYIPGLLIVVVRVADAGPAHAARGAGRGMNEDGQRCD